MDEEADFVCPCLHQFDLTEPVLLYFISEYKQREEISLSSTT